MVRIPSRYWCGDRQTLAAFSLFLLLCNGDDYPRRRRYYNDAQWIELARNDDRRRVADGDAQIRGEAVAEFLRRPGNSRFAIDRLRRRFSNLDPLFR